MTLTEEFGAARRELETALRALSDRWSSSPSEATLWAVQAVLSGRSKIAGNALLCAAAELHILWSDPRLVVALTEVARLQLLRLEARSHAASIIDAAHRLTPPSASF